MDQSEWALLEADAKARAEALASPPVEHHRPLASPDTYGVLLACSAEQYAASRRLYGAVLMQAVVDMHGAGPKMNRDDAQDARDFLSGSSEMLRLCEDTVGIDATSLLDLSLDEAQARLTRAIDAGPASLQPHHLPGMSLNARDGCWQTIPHSTGNRI